MKCPLYAVRDRKTGFLSPMVDTNDEAAKRNFAFAVQSSQPMFLAFPDDYELYRIGEYDTDSGEVFSVLPTHLCSARSLLVKDVKDDV